MKTRIISGAVAIFLMIGILYFSSEYPVVFICTVALLAAVAAFEILTTVGLRKNLLILLPSLAFSFLIPFIMFAFSFKYAAIYTVILAFILALLYFFSAVVFNKTVPFANAITSLGMIIFVSFSFGTIPDIFDFGNNLTVFLILLICTWGADSGAYFTGYFFGKHKLIPEVSPKKTVEGLIGGIVTSVVLLLAILWAMNGHFPSLADTEIIKYSITTVFSTLISVLGDLTFSQLKRTYCIKDFGKIMPGHGGVLDRFDSVLFVAPVLYFLFVIIL